MRKRSAKQKRAWDGSERLFDDPEWRDRFGLVVFKSMNPESRDDFVRGMIAAGLDATNLGDDELYPAALAYARAHSREQGGCLTMHFAGGFYAEYAENSPVWISRERLMERIRAAEAARGTPRT
jgi:hypothetical protein